MTGVVERGQIPCRECGRIHDCFAVLGEPKRYGSWADPIDGHIYRPYSWETVARVLVSRHGLPALEYLYAEAERLGCSRETQR